MSSEMCKSIKSCLIRSSQVSFGLPLLLFPSTVLNVVVVCLLLTCPNHLNLPSLILSAILATRNLIRYTNLSLKTSFRNRIRCM
ncbi:hypothetical protein Hanom_Chr10g00960571 [Helianthus anomalus]